MSGASPSKAVNCPRCKFPIPAEGVEAGTRLRCPKCHMEFLVAGSSLGRDLDEDEEFDMLGPLPAVSAVQPDASVENDLLPPRSEAEEVALYKQVMRDEELEKKALREKTKKEEDDEDGEEETEPVFWRPKKTRPAGMFRACIFSLFLNVELIIRLSCLAFLMFVSIFMLDKAFMLINVPAAGASTVLPWFGGMMLLASGSMLGIGCFFYAAALGMSILLDTSNGVKRVDSWPRGYFFDWLLETGYVASAIFWSLLPGVPLAWLCEGTRVPPHLVYAVSVAVLFPLAILAELDAGMFYFPGAPEVWKSPFHSLSAWIDFYILTVPLFALAATITGYAFENDLFWLLVLSSIFAAAVWLLYFRLLGRLAFYASGTMEARE